MFQMSFVPIYRSCERIHINFYSVPKCLSILRMSQLKSYFLIKKVLSDLFWDKTLKKGCLCHLCADEQLRHSAIAPKTEGKLKLEYLAPV